MAKRSTSSVVWIYWISFLIGLSVFGFGLYLTVQIGFVGGLLLGHPVWTPR